MGHFATKRQQSFVFSCLCSSFAEKRRIMEKEKLEMFATLLEKEKVHMFPGVTFRKICMWIGAEVGETDSYLESELGYGGEDILEAYRQSTRLYLKDKYGIDL